MTRERRNILIIGGMLLLVGLCYRFLPLESWVNGGDQQIEVKQRRLAKYNRLIRKNKDIDKQLREAKQAMKSLYSLLLDGETVALAAVDIQNTLTRIAGRTKVRIDRVDVRKPEKLTPGKLMAIPVRFNVESTVRQLRDLISAIESSTKLFRITDIRSRITKTKEPVVLKTSITLEGFIFED